MVSPLHKGKNTLTHCLKNVGSASLSSSGGELHLRVESAIEHSKPFPLLAALVLLFYLLIIRLRNSILKTILH